MASSGTAGNGAVRETLPARRIHASKQGAVRLLGVRGGRPRAGRRTVPVMRSAGLAACRPQSISRWTPQPRYPKRALTSKLQRALLRCASATARASRCALGPGTACGCAICRVCHVLCVGGYEAGIAGGGSASGSSWRATALPYWVAAPRARVLHAGLRLLQLCPAKKRVVALCWSAPSANHLPALPVLAPCGIGAVLDRPQQLSPASPMPPPPLPLSAASVTGKTLCSCHKQIGDQPFKFSPNYNNCWNGNTARCTEQNKTHRGLSFVLSCAAAGPLATQ